LDNLFFIVTVAISRAAALASRWGQLPLHIGVAILLLHLQHGRLPHSPIISLGWQVSEITRAC
jgi:hypothetical protein